jgi:hypothetical protein
MIRSVTPSHAACLCEITDSSPGEEQPRQSSPLLAVRDGYRYQPHRFRFRPHKPHEDDRDLFTVVLMQHFCPCIHVSSRSSFADVVLFSCTLSYGTTIQQSINVRKDMIRVTHLPSGELTVTTFYDALCLSEGVNLCLTLQHHLMVLPKSHTRERWRRDTPLRPCYRYLSQVCYTSGSLQT